MEIDITGKPREWFLTVNITGTFLGFTKLESSVEKTSGARSEQLIHHGQQAVAVTVTRSHAKKTASKIFGYSVAALISFAYINMGCALDLEVMKKVLRRPVGPAIGFVSQFLFMPICSFVLGYIFPWSSPEMRLGLFVTGCSPGGGASNIWTVMFGGNLDLSVTMTAISTFAAFVMMPAWIFSLGQVIFHDEDRAIVIPYYKICIYAFCLVIPLSIGLLIARFAPRLSKFLVRILKPMALFLILFIMIFGVWANLYIFRLMTWPVFLTGMGLPWIGFAFGCTIARLTKRPAEDVIAIAIETGVQNTGMAIFILWFTLDQPLGDMTAVVPVAAATMTPIPLLLGLLVKKITERFCSPEITATSEQKVCGIIKGTNIPEKCNQPLENLQFEDTFKESESTQKLMINVESPPEEESPSRR